ncbi:putative phosphatidate phosphatase [Sitodiplosis mosellana]|uniref:putative phosphatidate phosphatase n=1 Tax=Sitodiplosis mosellana TaxID=263140 RepID=UPI00244391F6|nr:putative phosphatidate phosphatase [Sitodiplosis mosellana]
MSQNYEPSELTPLRRSNYSRTQPQIAAAATATSASNRLQSTDFSEYMSINNNNHPVGSDSSRGDTSEPNSQQAFNPKSFIMSDTRRVMTRVSIDFVILLSVGLPILALFLWGDPYKRGFFCDDESLKHPFHDSTVRSWMLYITGLILPLGLICATEIIQAKLNKIPDKTKLQLFGWSIPTWITNAYRQIGVFAFGAALNTLTTDIAKYSIGRLRPHFFDVCKPILLDGTNCSDDINRGRYIENFKCLGDSGERLLKEVHLSFPSGHSSFSCYTMLYCAIYLQARMTWRGSRLLKHFLQYVLIMMAWFTCMSRISDYKHHWSDVLAGGLIGVTVASLIANFVADLGFRKAQNNNCTNTVRYELGTHTATNNGTINV